MYFELVIPGDPVAKQRPRMWKQGGKARTYTPTETRHYENKITDPRDVDNLAKCLMDGLEKAGVYVNDRQIVRMSIEKVYTQTRPRAELHLHSTGGTDVAAIPARDERTSLSAHSRRAPTGR